MRYVSALLLSFLLFACGEHSSDSEGTGSNAAPEHVQQQLDKLVGEWTDERDSGRTVFHERWSKNTEGGLTGLGFVLSGKDTVFIEYLGIMPSEQGFHYSATIRSQNEGKAILFALVHDRDSLVFTNPAHDFPQRIVYAHTADGHWDVTVSGATDGGMVTDRLHFSRRGPQPGQVP